MQGLGDHGLGLGFRDVARVCSFRFRVPGLAVQRLLDCVSGSR